MLPPEVAQPITTGRVLGEALAVFARRWWQSLIVEAVYYVPVRAADRTIPSPWALLVMLVEIGVGGVALGAVAWAVLHPEDVRGTGLGVYRRIVAPVPRLVQASLVESIALILGFIALIVPGLLLIARWSVLVPAIVAEETSRFGFGRSADLTSGRRWIGLWVALLPWLASLVLIVPSIVVGGDVILWVGDALGLVVTTYGAIAAAVFYRRLVAIPQYAADVGAAEE